MNWEITGKVIFEISHKTIPGLVLPEIVYGVGSRVADPDPDPDNLAGSVEILIMWIQLW